MTRGGGGWPGEQRGARASPRAVSDLFLPALSPAKLQLITRAILLSQTDLAQSTPTSLHTRAQASSVLPQPQINAAGPGNWLGPFSEGVHPPPQWVPET